MLILFVLSAGCATTGGFKKAETTGAQYDDLNIYGQFDREFSSTYFGSFKFVFENTTDQWLNLDHIQLFFDNDSAEKYIKVLNRSELGQWVKSVQLQTNLNSTTLKEIQSAVISTGSNISSVIGDVSAGIGLTEEQKTYPKNHLYAENFILPPGFAVEKWVLFKSSHHGDIPYLTTVTMRMLVNSKPRQVNIKYRENNPKYDHFLWYDPEPAVNMDFYLGANISMAYPTGDFYKVALKGDRLFSSFGINGYLAIFKEFGINFSLDYQTYEARGKITSIPDSTITLGTNFEFYQWRLFNFLISPRYLYNLTKELDLFVELTGGLALSFSPRVIATRYGLEIYEIESVSAFSLVAGGGIGTRINFNQKLNLDLKLEYIPFSQANFELEDNLFGSLARKQNMDQLKIKASLNWKL